MPFPLLAGLAGGIGAGAGAGAAGGGLGMAGLAGGAGAAGTAGGMVGELGAGTADVPSSGTFCKIYGVNGDKPPTVVSGVANGISINVSATGAGGLAMGSVSATLIAD